MSVSISPPLTMLIDTREQAPLPLSLPFLRQGLYSGDYSYLGGEPNFAIERKSLDDLAGCLGTDRGRFEQELHRLRGFQFARLLVIGTEDDLAAGRFRSRLNPKAAVNSLDAFEARYVPVVFAATPEEGANLVERWATWHAREFQRVSEQLSGGGRPRTPA